MARKDDAARAFIVANWRPRGVVWGAYASLLAAQQATPALRERHAVPDEHPTLIQEWRGDQMVTEWRYHNETGWSQSLATFNAHEAASSTENHRGDQTQHRHPRRLAGARSPIAGRVRGRRHRRSVHSSETGT